MDVKNPFPRPLLSLPDFIIIISDSLFNCLQGNRFMMVMCGPFLLANTFFNNDLNLLYIHIDCIIPKPLTTYLIAYGLLIVDTVTQDLRCFRKSHIKTVHLLVVHAHRADWILNEMEHLDALLKDLVGDLPEKDVWKKYGDNEEIMCPGINNIPR
ncbi:hypothetical protein L210DRAFT_3502503 [Boletus edulis BED1]|uniref:Uncharacterized protein n=1 Tax=Boletus edulis BED1 TaxID=1328754 RepID=A0AAD4BZ30_BOLED|nr:hypothetical protein L210DRAFT_3502503 [Boletus edulis BED1]